MIKPDNMGSIYKITNIVNNKIIIGQTKYLRIRWSSYRSLLRKNRYSNGHLQNAWNKYGEQNFKFEVIFTCPVQDLDFHEIRLIDLYDSTNREKGYNLDSGGKRPEHSEETKEKIRQWNLGRKMSDEAKEKMSASRMGNKNHAFGKHQSEEHKKKRARSGEENGMYGKTISDEHKRKLSEVHKGKPLLEEHRRKIGEANHRNMTPEMRQKLRELKLGKPRTEEDKQKMREGWLRRKLQKESLNRHELNSCGSDEIHQLRSPSNPL